VTKGFIETNCFHVRIALHLEPPDNLLHGSVHSKNADLYSAT